MKILCGISGIEFDVQHFPGYLTQREAVHPIFNMQQKDLLSAHKKWIAGELTEIDSYLLYLALFNSTDLIEWRVPAKRTLKTKAIVAQNMESLGRVIGKINLVSHPAFVLHKVAISKDTCDLSTSHFWIDSWNQSYVNFCEGYKAEVKHDRIARREQKLDSLFPKIGTVVGYSIERYAKILAEWAADVGEFPTHNVRVNGEITTLADYWKSIILRCCRGESIFTIPQLHLLKLQEYCEEMIDLHGSTHGHNLMIILNGGLSKLADPFGLNIIDFNSTHPGFVMLKTEERNSTEEANIAAMIAAAPSSLPLESEIGAIYPSKLAYMRALFRWQAAEKAKQEKQDIIDRLEATPEDEVEIPEEYDESTGPNPLDLPGTIDLDELKDEEDKLGDDEENL